MRTLWVVGWISFLLGYGPLGVSYAQSIEVSPTGPFTSLTAALQEVGVGDTIYVRPGVYKEPTLVVDKTVHLIGEQGAILDGANEREIMRITAPNVEVRGFTFRNVGISFIEDNAAIKVERTSGCLIAGNTLENTFFGIYLAKTSDCIVRDNQIRGEAVREVTSGNGIHLWDCQRITIEHNQIAHHRDGIYFEFVKDSYIAHNTSQENLRYGLHFMFSDRCIYEFNTFRENMAGVAVMYTNHVTMRRNIFQHNWGSASYGLLLKDINDSQVIENRFIQNSIGLYAEDSDRLTVERNQFQENGWAVRILTNSQQGYFRHNNFIANSFDVGTNGKHHTSRFEENFWDQYTGYDLDRDGVGDIPYYPVRLFAFIVEQNPPALILLRSFFVELLDAAERVLPVLTPETLADHRPKMKPIP